MKIEGYYLQYLLLQNIFFIADFKDGISTLYWKMVKPIYIYLYPSFIIFINKWR